MVHVIQDKSQLSASAQACNPTNNAARKRSLLPECSASV